MDKLCDAILQTKTRVEYFDVMKGIGIILVTWAHLFPTTLLVKFIYSFHMPMFFFLSGLLFRKADNLKEFVFSRARRLLLPYMFYGGVSISIEMLFGGGYKRIT